MKAIRILKKLRMGALAAGVSAALLVPSPQPAEASSIKTWRNGDRTSRRKPAPSWTA